MPTDYIAEAKDAVIIGILQSILFLGGSWLLIYLSGGWMTVSLDIQGLINAILSNQLTVALSTLGGIILVGVITKFIPPIRNTIGI